MKRRMACTLLLLAGLLTVGAAPLVNAQGPQQKRLGRPYDWSHRHVVASRGGPDHGLSIYADWRTYFRHIEIDQTLAAQKAAKERAQATERTKATLAALWMSLSATGLLGLVVGRRRKSSALCVMGACLLGLATMAGCGAAPGGSGPPGSAAAMALDWSINTSNTGAPIGSVTSAPAKFSFDISASNCSDVIYFTVNQAGSDVAPLAVNVIAVTNAYAGCSGNATGSTPTIKFGIALPNPAGQLSPVLSLDGTILYVMEARPSASGGPILRAINVDNITTNPGAYDFGTGQWTAVHTLAAPTGMAGSEQLFAVAFTGVSNTRSSPYLDYTNNRIFFGDTVGRVHRVTSVNTSTPTADGGGFPVTCGANELRAPVFVSNQVIATSADGRVYRIDISGAGPYSCVASAAVGAGTGATAGELASPVIDVTNSKIIVVTGADTANGDKRMALLNLTFTAGAGSVSSVLIGPGSTVLPRIPDFDNAFLTTNSGNLYVGGSPTGANGAYLIRVGYNGSTLTGPLGFAELHHTGAAGDNAYSPVTVFLTASLLANPEFAYIGGSGARYQFMNRISAGFAGTNAVPVAMDSFFPSVGTLPGGCDSSIIIDNRTGTVTGAGATANIYFGTVGASPTPSTVVQLAQQF